MIQGVSPLLPHVLLARLEPDKTSERVMLIGAALSFIMDPTRVSFFEKKHLHCVHGHGQNFCKWVHHEVCLVLAEKKTFTVKTTITWLKCKHKRQSAQCTRNHAAGWGAGVFTITNACVSHFALTITHRRLSPPPLSQKHVWVTLNNNCGP